MINYIIITIAVWLLIALIRYKKGSVNSSYSILTSATRGNLPRLEKCIEKGIDINFQGPGGFTALINASYAGHLEVVEYLINHGANLDIQNNKGYTALAGSALSNHIEIVDLLITNGADKKIIIDDGLDILAMIQLYPDGYEKILSILGSSSENQEPNRVSYPPKMKSFFDVMWTTETGMPLGDSPIFDEDDWGHWTKEETVIIKKTLFATGIGITVQALSQIKPELDFEVKTSFYNYYKTEKNHEPDFNKDLIFNALWGFSENWRSNPLNVIINLISKHYDDDLASKIDERSNANEISSQVNYYLVHMFYSDKLKNFESLPELENLIDSSFTEGMYN